MQLNYFDLQATSHFWQATFKDFREKKEYLKISCKFVRIIIQLKPAYKNLQFKNLLG